MKTMNGISDPLFPPWHNGSIRCQSAWCLTTNRETRMMKIADLKKSGHWPTLLTAFLYFDFSFMVWTVLGPLGAQIGEALHLNAAEKGMMVAVPILSGAFL